MIRCNLIFRREVNRISQNNRSLLLMRKERNVNSKTDVSVAVG